MKPPPAQTGRGAEEKIGGISNPLFRELPLPVKVIRAGIVRDDAIMTPILHALELGRLGLDVFPVGRDKAPRCPRGYLAASSDPATIENLHLHYGFILIGVATGARSGWSALDIDAPAGLPWWEENRPRIPATRTHRTRSAGLHLWFRHMPGLRSSVARIAPGIDVRADGGSCIWWPADGLPVLSDAAPAEWPAWLVPPAKPAPEPWCSDDAPRPPQHVEASLAGLVRSIATAGEGRRNATLHWSACRAAEMTARGEIARRHAEAVLIEAAARCGLDHQEAAATIASAYRAGGR